MHEMTKGSNVGLAALSDDTGSVIVSLGWSSAAGAGDADVSVLLLGGNGKVRSDADFFFYNNPASPTAVCSCWARHRPAVAARTASASI